jgi:hypothetical protein
MAQCNPSMDIATTATVDQALASGADAVRYVVLRKLAAGMRHTLMGELQGIQFAADLAAQIVKRGVTGTKLDDALNQISAQTRGATAASRSIMEWLRPEVDASIEVATALQECVKVAGEVWILRGIRATTQCAASQGKVVKAVFFEVVVVSLLALTDMHSGSLDIGIVANQVDGKVVIAISARSADRMSAAPPLLHRALTFDDVRLVAKADGVACVCDDATITLEFQSLPA